MTKFRLIRTAIEITLSFTVAGIATKALFKKPDEKVIVNMDNTPTTATADAVNEVTDNEVEESI